jgi:hypothetical protein
VKVGDEVTVLYDPDTPEHAEVSTFATLWFAPLFLVAFGLFFAVGGYLFLLAMRFAARHQQQMASSSQ